MYRKFRVRAYQLIMHFHENFIFEARFPCYWVFLCAAVMKSFAGLGCKYDKYAYFPASNAAAYLNSPTIYAFHGNHSFQACGSSWSSSACASPSTQYLEIIGRVRCNKPLTVLSCIWGHLFFITVLKSSYFILFAVIRHVFNAFDLCTGLYFWFSSLLFTTFNFELLSIK
jgi:hypothetical protein